jgi:clan AA aspartic protease
MILTRNGTVGRVHAQVELTSNYEIMMVELKMLPPEKVQRITVQALVDTGATDLILPPAIVAQLGLTPSKKTKVVYADRREAERDVVTNVCLQYQGRQGIFSAVVEPSRTDALIGAIVLEALDLVVDCKSQTLAPRDPSTTITEIG